MIPFLAVATITASIGGYRLWRVHQVLQRMGRLPIDVQGKVRKLLVGWRVMAGYNFLMTVFLVLVAYDAPRWSLITFAVGLVIVPLTAFALMRSSSVGGLRGDPDVEAVLKPR